MRLQKKNSISQNHFMEFELIVHPISEKRLKN
jgi:hypothetical protein